MCHQVDVEPNLWRGPDVGPVGSQQAGHLFAQGRKGFPLASDSAVDRALAEAAGPRLANSSSRATSRPTLRPGLSISSSQRRLAGGRYQGPALRSPSFMVNGPRRVTRTRASPRPWASLTAPAATRGLSHDDQSEVLGKASSGPSSFSGRSKSLPAPARAALPRPRIEVPPPATPKASHWAAPSGPGESSLATKTAAPASTRRPPRGRKGFGNTSSLPFGTRTQPQ